MDKSFPPSRRLRHSREIQSVFDKGDFFRGRYVHLVRGVRDPDHPTRAAFIVSAKTASRAVDRNRIKRLMRESFRHLQNGIGEGWPLVFLATREADPGLKRQDIQDDMSRLLREANLREDAV